ncbi:MAG: hypothetical protein Q7U52_11335 [Hydrogenophaga sp.]|nr:hypothetical protein [Hydrogenophaga sp.]MDO9148232.1 hypothetical protein [Hydrogenophaga sp.]MDO9606084.1 hypothetical protein [Hydrogenophaga sp.]MDP2164819.1 hypothetical protein [Hydrogenophaga sp.]MDP3477413.1 hypothetical protein [Hydrogenophaga sp.]
MIDPRHTIRRTGLIGCTVVCGILELFALQRARYLARRSRKDTVWHR